MGTTDIITEADCNTITAIDLREAALEALHDTERDTDDAITYTRSADGQLVEVLRIGDRAGVAAGANAEWGTVETIERREIILPENAKHTAFTLEGKAIAWRTRDEGGDSDLEYWADDEYDAEVAANEAMAEAYAAQMSPDDGTMWVRFSLIDPRGEMVTSGGVTVEPEEPQCMDENEHDWQSPHAIVGGVEENPGVHGHGGGVVITEVCMRCGCGRHTDTWAQDSSGRQGLRSVKYVADEFSVELSEALEESA